MKLNANQLEQHLQRQLLPVYLVSGDESLLVQESVALIRSAARKQGFAERERFFVESRFNWEEVLLSANSLSLFAEKKIIELHFRQGRFLQADSKAIETLLTALDGNTLLLIVMPRLESGVNRSALYKKLDAQGITLAIWPVEREKLPAWIAERLRRYQMKASSDAIQYLADNTEGNLLATQQEIEKLYLLHQQNNIDLTTMMTAVSNSSRYTVFNYIDRCLQGNTQQALRTLYGLRDEGDEPLGILAMLGRELRTLYNLKQAQANRENIKQAMMRSGVFAIRQNLVQNALGRLPLTTIEQLLQQLYQIDQSVKGMSDDLPWLQLEQITVQLSSGKPLSYLFNEA